MFNERETNNDSNNNNNVAWSMEIRHKPKSKPKLDVNNSYMKKITRKFIHVHKKKHIYWAFIVSSLCWIHDLFLFVSEVIWTLKLLGGKKSCNNIKCYTIFEHAIWLLSSYNIPKCATELINDRNLDGETFNRSTEQ